MTPISTTESLSPVNQGFVDFLRQYRDRLTLTQPGGVSSEEFGEWMKEAESNRKMVAEALSSFNKRELTNFVKIYLGIDERETLAARAVNCKLGGYGSTNNKKLSDPDTLPGIVWTKAAEAHYEGRKQIELESLTRTRSPNLVGLNSERDKPGDTEGISPNASRPQPVVANTPIELIIHLCRVGSNPERFKRRLVAFDPKDPTGFGVDENGSPRFEDGGESLGLLHVPRDQKDSYKDFEKVMREILAKKMERNVVMAFVRGFLQENFPQEVALASRPAPDGN